MATGTLFPAPWFTAEDGNGKPVSGALANFYIAGTTTAATTYSDVALSIANANPVVADGFGRIGPVFLTPGQSYKLVLTDASAVVMRTQDNIQGVPTSSNNVDITGTAGQSLSAGQAVYLSDGSGSKTAGQWFPADIANGYSSTFPKVGMAPAAVSSGASGTFRIGGQVTGLSSLTVGTTYYLSTSGAITATAPVNRRPIGMADSTSSLILFDQPTSNAAVIDHGLCEFRLTLTTATPVTTADVTAATTLFCAPYKGNRLALYDANGVPTIYASPEISIAVPATTSQMYDVFGIVTAGAPALELLAWTNDTTRATGLVATVVAGILTKSGDATRRYLGSFRTTTVSGQTEDSFAKRYVWNNYNRAKRACRVSEATGTWTYTTATFRQANGATTNQLDVVVGFAEVLLEAEVTSSFQNTNIGVNAFVSIGEDSTTTPVAGIQSNFGQSQVAASPQYITAKLRRYVPIGRHTYVWLEQSAATGTTTWYGVSGSTIQSGIHGSIDG